MATRHGHQEAFTVDLGLKSADKKNQFDHDAETLFVQAKNATEAAKVMSKNQKKIVRKQQQTKCKNLQKCIEIYNNSLMEIHEAVNKMQEILSDGGFQEKELPRKKPYYWSHQPQESKNRPMLHMDLFSSPRIECMMCIKKDKDIKELEARLESFKRKEKEHETQLKEALQAYDQLQEERDFKIRNRQETEMRREKDSKLQSKLIDNNTNIADLSDHNRPTKIAEKLSELYDNQWKDAYDALQRKQMKDEEIIKILKDLMFRAFRKCESIASEKYFEKVQRFIELPVQGASVPRVSVLPDTLKQQIKDFRKLRAEYVIEDLEKTIKNELESANSHLEAVQTYISGCIEISWLMAVQDPPLVLSTDVPLKFDTNLFKHYTRRGKYVEFVVWPVLYLHEGGAVLAKGVVQGSNHPSRVQ